MCIEQSEQSEKFDLDNPSMIGRQGISANLNLHC